MRYSHNLFLDCYDGTLHWQFGYDAPQFLNQDDYILMQFTGLTDRHGTEIFEGDIVKSNDDSLAVVEWDHKHAGFRTAWKTGWRSGEISDSLVLTLEVLGNLYEHPQLLTNRT